MARRRFCWIQAGEFYFLVELRINGLSVINEGSVRVRIDISGAVVTPENSTQSQSSGGVTVIQDDPLELEAAVFTRSDNFIIRAFEVSEVPNIEIPYSFTLEVLTNPPLTPTPNAAVQCSLTVSKIKKNDESTIDFLFRALSLATTNPIGTIASESGVLTL